MNLHEYMTDNGFTYAELADKLGVSKASIWKIINRKDIRFSTAKKLIERSSGQISINDLFEYMVPAQAHQKKRSARV